MTTITNAKLKKAFNQEAMLVTFSMGEGRSYSLDINALDENIKLQALAHGLLQKIGDATAIDRDEGGRSATVDTKWQALVEVADRLKSGAWNKLVKAGEKEWQDTIAALIAYKGATGDASRIAALVAWIEAKAEKDGRAVVFATRDALPAWASEYTKIKSKKITSVDANQALDELAGL